MKKSLYFVLAVVALLFVLAFGGYGQRQSQGKISWEYLTVSNWDAQSQKATDLNKLGAQGWELVSVGTTDSSGNTLLYFKRVR
jgi:hypothetical protein